MASSNGRKPGQLLRLWLGLGRSDQCLSVLTARASWHSLLENSERGLWGPDRVSPGSGKTLTLTGQTRTLGSFPGTPIPLPYGAYLLLSSYGLDFQGKGRRTGPFFPAVVLARPESHDLASWNSMSTGVMLPFGQLGERTKWEGCLCHGGG